MSLIYDKGRHRHSTDKNTSKLKSNNNNQINQQNTLKNNDKKKGRKNQNIFNEYLTSSPLGNNNIKKPPILTTINNSNNRNVNITKNKIPQNKRLNFNKSFEGKIDTDNILKNFDFLKDEIYLNIRGKNKEYKNLVNN
jgi:hypothetical protein